MNPVPQNPTDAAHRDLQNILLNGRILIDGLSLTGTELGSVIQGERMLYAKATQLDKASALAATKKAEKNPEKKPNVIPLKQPEKKE